MNKVIIVGGDHYNALGLARMFGVNGVLPYGILIISNSNMREAYAYKSKYWKKTWFAKDESEALKILMERFENESEKPVILPSSDGAEEMLDCNLNILGKKFLLPGINETEGEVFKLMDKYNQFVWAKDMGFKIADTQMIDLSETSVNLSNVKYPCILKPIISSQGKKEDITKCTNESELITAITVFKEKCYKNLLLQEYLNKDFEVELFGCITKNTRKTPYLLTEHIREWPPVGGSVSCHKYIVNDRLKKEAELIMKKISDYGYSGNIDIELFMINGEFYLNEVNFRNSGDVYASFRNKLFYAYIYYLDLIGGSTEFMNVIYDDKKYAMNETTDFRHVLFGKMKLRDWLLYYRNCGDFALRFKGDMKPAFRRYFYFFRQTFIKSDSQKVLARRR